MEREKFEESWKNAFDKAEVSPSDKVWVDIELELEKAKGGYLKRRLLFYQMLAAASVVFAMAIGGVAYYVNFTNKPSSANNLAAETKSPSTQITPLTENSAKELNSTPLTREQAHAKPEQFALNPSAKENDRRHQQDNDPADPSLSSAPLQTPNGKDDGQPAIADAETAHPGILPDNSGSEVAALPHAINDRDLAPFYTPGRIQVDMRQQQEEVDPVVAMMARLEQRESEIRGEKKNKKDESSLSEKLWTSVGFAAGSFNTIQSSGASAPTAAMNFAAPIVDQETKASGYAYSMGVNVGTKLSARWVLQGGVNYLTHSSEYTANNVVLTSTGAQQQRFRAATTNEIIHSNANDLNNKIVYSAPYNVNNSMRYLSVPMQAGYLLINKTFGLQLNAGVATDLFLQNTVTPDSKDLDKTTQPGGADSPYRSVNLSGLFGTEVSYKFGDRYRVSVNPGVRYPFSTIYKTELGVQASPLTFDVGLRFRYIFH